MKRVIEDAKIKMNRIEGYAQAKIEQKKELLEKKYKKRGSK